jgi:hypothetical protein
MSRPLSKEEGLGLIEVVIALGFLTIVFAGLSKAVTYLSKSAQKIDASVDLTSIRAQIAGSVDCPKTMAGRTPGGACPSATYIDLRNAMNGVVVSKDGQTIAPWTVLAQCDPSGITVRAAKLVKGKADFNNTDPANFRSDEMNANLPYSFTGHPKAALFAPNPTNPSSGLCGAWFGGTHRSQVKLCGSGEVMTGMDMTKGEPVCAKAPSLPSSCPQTGSVLTWNGSGFVCTNPQTLRVASEFNDIALGELESLISLSLSSCSDIAHNKNPDGSAFYANSACRRYCGHKGMAGGMITECNGNVSPNKATCSCVP